MNNALGAVFFWLAGVAGAPALVAQPTPPDSPTANFPTEIHDFALIAVPPAALDSLPNPDSLSNEQVMAEAFRLADWAVNLQNFCTQNALRAAAARQARQDEIEILERDTLATDEQLKTLKNTLGELKAREKEAAQQRKKADEAAKFALKNTQKDTASARKNLRKVFERVEAMQRFLEPQKPAEPAPEELRAVMPQPVEKPKNEPEPAPEMPVEEKKPAAPQPPQAKKFARYAPETDVLLSPPQPPCAFVFDGVDEFSGEVRRETRREELFRYTNDFMKPYLKDTPHILCEANIVVSGSLATLNLVFTITDQNARRAFGGIGQGSQAALKLIDGSAFNLQNLRADEGQTDESGRVTVFRAQYGLDKILLKRLSESELDKLRIMWSKGHEDYEIYNIDLLKRQARCLLNLK